MYYISKFFVRKIYVNIIRIIYVNFTTLNKFYVVIIIINSYICIKITFIKKHFSMTLHTFIVLNLYFYHMKCKNNYHIYIIDYSALEDDVGSYLF